MIPIHALLQTDAVPEFSFRPVAEQPPPGLLPPTYATAPLNSLLHEQGIGPAIGESVEAVIGLFDRSLEITAPYPRAHY